MLDKKKQLVEELLAHLDMAQGEDLKSLIDSKKPKVSVEKIEVIGKKPGMDDMDSKVNDAINGIESPEQEESEGAAHEAMESPDMEKSEHAMEGMGDDDKLSDEDLKEMLKKYLG
jgi:hypothetical protein